MQKFIKQWLPVVVLMAVIFFFSSIPSQEMPRFGSWDTLVKKSGHLLEYALLGLTFLRGQQSNHWRSYGYALVGVILYALTDEYHQSFVPGRTSTLIDVGIDTIGALIGLTVIRFSQPIRRLLFQAWIES
jgi:VanZ family protein